MDSRTKARFFYYLLGLSTTHEEEEYARFDGSLHRNRERLLTEPSGLIFGEARRTLARGSCVCIGRDPGGRKRNEKGFHSLTRARREHQARLQQSRAQAV